MNISLNDYNANMLKPRLAQGKITQIENGWRLEIGEGRAGSYRLAQLDDYACLARRRFAWREQASLGLRCRVSQPSLPGTWGFGFWNDPFALSFGLQGTARRLPVLPNTCWFFHASPENHLSFAQMPANGFLAQAFRSPRLPAALFAPGLLAAPLLFSRMASKWLRANCAARAIGEQAKRLSLDVTAWHEYRLRWGARRVEYAIDGEAVFESETSPQGPLGLVIWIDNQFAAWRPDGSLGAGALANPPAWMEISHLSVETGSP
jgi:hypothetical protein